MIDSPTHHILPQHIKLDIDEIVDLESAEIRMSHGVGDETDSDETMIVFDSRIDDSETDTVDGDASFIDERGARWGRESDGYIPWAILSFFDSVYGSSRVDMTCDEVSIDRIAVLDRSLDIETLSDFFVCKIRLGKTLFHDEETIALLTESRDCHTSSVVSDALSENEITKDILHRESPMIDSQDGWLSGDDTGEHDDTMNKYSSPLTPLLRHLDAPLERGSLPRDIFSEKVFEVWDIFLCTSSPRNEVTQGGEGG